MEKVTTFPERAPSALRMTYRAEASQIRKKHGDLEDIRRKLGLSKRKICQLLLVDPSSWTRWTQSKQGAPPHIYRALEWYLKSLERPYFKGVLDENLDFDLQQSPQPIWNRIQQLQRQLNIWRALLLIHLLVTVLILLVWV